MITNIEIVESLKSKVAAESKLLVEILNLLEKVRDRRIYTEYGYSSLFDFCTKELHYSEGAAMRRIQALKLQVQSPVIKKLIHKKLEEGSLNLSQLGAVAKLERSENLSTSQICTAILASSTASARDADKVIREQLNLQPAPRKTKVILELDSAQLTKAEALAARFSHSLEQKNLAGLFLYLLERETQRGATKSAPRKNGARKNGDRGAAFGTVEKVSSAQSPSHPAVEVDTEVDSEKKRELNFNNAIVNVSHYSPVTPLPPTSAVSSVKPSFKSDARLSDRKRFAESHSRRFSATISREAFRRSGGRCEYVSPITKKRCEGRWYLQLDHVRPWSLAGASALENCRVVCGSHNRSEWQRVVARQ